MTGHLSGCAAVPSSLHRVCCGWVPTETSVGGLASCGNLLTFDSHYVVFRRVRITNTETALSDQSMAVNFFSSGIHVEFT